MSLTDTQLVPVVTQDGTHFRVEVRRTGEIPKVGGYKAVGALEKTVEAIDTLPFDTVTTALVNVGNALSAAIDQVKPKKASIEFGMAVTLEAGKLTALVCQGKATANFTVKFEWER